MKQALQRRHDTGADTENNASFDLVQRIKAGDVSAEGEAWLRYHARLRGAVRRYADSEDDINDRISATWEIVLPKLRAGELINPCALGAFLCAIARSVALGELRKRRWLTTSGDTQYLEQALVNDRTPFDEVLEQQQARVTMDLIGEMPVARDRDLMAMSVAGEVSRDEMCEKYGVDSEQLSKLLSRARKRLCGMAARGRH